MKTKNKIMLAVLTLGASALLASAQDTNGAPDGPGPGRHGHRHPPDLLMITLDANHDGVIDADEIASAPAALKAMDKNGDGKLTPDELRPPRPPQAEGADSGMDQPPGPPPGERPDMSGTNAAPNGPGPGMRGHRPPPSALFRALDANHDGVIDADEIANAPAALKALDKNGDGKLTPDELRPPRPPQAEGADSGMDQPPGAPPDQQ